MTDLKLIEELSAEHVGKSMGLQLLQSRRSKLGCANKYVLNIFAVGFVVRLCTMYFFFFTILYTDILIGGISMTMTLGKCGTRLALQKEILRLWMVNARDNLPFAYEFFVCLVCGKGRRFVCFYLGRNFYLQFAHFQWYQKINHFLEFSLYNGNMFKWNLNKEFSFLCWCCHINKSFVCYIYFIPSNE